MILVTGSNGFIGSQICGALTQRQHQVIGVDPVPLADRPKINPPSGYVKFLHRDALWDYLKSVSPRPKWVIHMGANSSTTEKNRDHLQEVNTLYTERLFSWCAENQVPLIFASSAATYGNGELGYDDQIDPNQLKPMNLYGESKLLVDQWVLRQTKTPPRWYALRFFNVYGPGEDYKASMVSVPFKAFHEIRSTGSLKLFKSYRPDYGHGEQKRDFIYVKDIVSWTLELMEKLPSSGIYNMGTGQARSWLDLGKAAFKVLGLEPNIEFIDMPDHLKNQYQYFTEAKMEKWTRAGMPGPRWSLEAGIEDYYLNHLMKGTPWS